MKKANRLAALLLTISLSIALVSLIRANPTKYENNLFIEPHESQEFEEGIWAPQKVWIQLSAENKISLHIMDQHISTPIVSFESISQLSYKFTIPARKTYSIRVENPRDEPTSINVTATFYDFETDLVTISIITLAFGIAIPPIHYAKQRLGRRPGKQQPPDSQTVRAYYPRLRSRLMCFNVENSRFVHQNGHNRILA